LDRTYRDDPAVFLWDLEGANPYRAILGLADRLIVTGDSVSMISEAISTPRSVDVLDLGFPRHAGFLRGLVESGRVRRFTGDPDYPRAAPPVNATQEAAAMVRRRLAELSGQT
jgi:mitochondrial fission protein ELM1